jgi:hypothetical protein
LSKFRARLKKWSMVAAASLLVFGLGSQWGPTRALEAGASYVVGGVATVVGNALSFGGRKLLDLGHHLWTTPAPVQPRSMSWETPVAGLSSLPVGGPAGGVDAPPLVGQSHVLSAAFPVTGQSPMRPLSTSSRSASELGEPPLSL